MDWTPAMIARLGALWTAGHSTAEIGRIMDISKNAVVGKAHRIGLPGRPAPIRRRADGVRIVKPPTVVQRVAAVKAAIAAPATPPAEDTAPVRLYPKPCCWPIGTPKLPGFHFCGRLSLPGKPYCRPHCDIAYEREFNAALALSRLEKRGVI